MSDRESVNLVASDIAQWQNAALQLPLAEVSRHDGHLAERAWSRA